MIKLDILHEYGKELERRMKLQTSPLAVKLLQKERDIPKGTERPMRDFGYHVAACQGLAKSRREGTPVAMVKKDMWCPEGVVGYGLAEPPPFFYEGRQRYPQSVESLKAGRIWAREFPRLKAGKYIGVISAPLTACKFRPDVIVVYCDSAQLGMLLLAVGSKEGHELTCTVSAKGACIYSVVPPFQTGKYQVTVPCPGDRRFAGAQHDEMIFSFPAGKLKSLLSSLKYLEGFGYRLPLRYVMKPEAEMPANYVTIANLMGMDWMKGNEMAKYAAWQKKKK